MSDDPRKAFLSYLSELKTRSLIVEFKGALSIVSGVFNLSGISESNVQLRLAGSTCATCQLDIRLPALRSFRVTSFTEAMNGVLKPAVEALAAEAGHLFQSDVVEQVAVVAFADDTTLLIGALKEATAWPATSIQTNN